jgi:hypothetical protein
MSPALRTGRMSRRACSKTNFMLRARAAGAKCQAHSRDDRHERPSIITSLHLRIVVSPPAAIPRHTSIRKTLRRERTVINGIRSLQQGGTLTASLVLGNLDPGRRLDHLGMAQCSTAAHLLSHASPTRGNLVLKPSQQHEFRYAAAVRPP